MAILLAMAPAAALAQSQAPNIILFLADDQGWNGTSVQMDPDVPGSKSDYYLTPNLEALAERGMRFSRAYSAAPLCQPTRASIQSGMSTAQLQYTDNFQGGLVHGARYSGNYTGFPLTPPIPTGLSPDTLTIARWFEQHRPEYVSAHIGKWHMENDPATSADAMGYEFVEDFGHSADDPWGISQITSTAADFMQERVQSAEPFFMQVSHRAVHLPIRARAETIEMFENRERGAIHRSAGFAAMTYELDTSLGGILDAIRDLGIEDNTYIIYASDNGAPRSHSLPNPLGGGKNFLHEGGIRVPMVVAGPGVEAGAVSRVPVISTDLLSTISELAGIEAPLPDAVEGTSLAPVFFNGGELPAGTESLVRDFGPNGELFFHSPHNFGASNVFRIPPVSAVVRGDWKLLKLWGENGQPDQVYLTHLSEDYLEPNRLNPSSPSNEAHEFPGLAADLEATLMGWLEGVDASLPYDVKKEIELNWDAGQPGVDPRGWRSTTDVDYVLRETWSRGSGAGEPDLVSVEPLQPGLARNAFRFDGGDGMTRKFFHVSDLIDRRTTPDSGTADFDRSASFEFWVRLDDLDGEHVLFESGDLGQGLSITLGDADSDGVHDEVRMRGRGDDGQFLSVTADLDQFTNPTRDFVHLAAVLNDAPDDRHAELFVNGASLARVSGLAGAEGSIRWDGFGAAGLGSQDGTGLGAGGGNGDLPFSGAGLRGDLAHMRFYNHAISAEVVRGHYNSVLDPAGLGISRLSGDAIVPQERPSDVSEGALEADDTIFVMQERTDVLDAALTLDFAAPGLGGETLPAGTEFTSFLIHYDPSGDPSQLQTAEGEVRFAAPVLGVLYEPESLSETDAILGSIGRYDVGSHERQGFFSLDPDGRSLTFLMSALGDEVTQLRVLTERAILIDGDYNGDLRVDQSDLDLVLIHWGDDGTIPPEGWRANLPDGLIGQPQLDAVLVNWGETSTSLTGRSAPIAAPEPGTLALLGSMGLGGLLWRMRKRSGRKRVDAA